MTQVPDYRGRIESEKPHDLLHKIAGVIPGYNGYQDRERRRDADKELRMFLARRYREQHAALMGVQGQLARSGQLQSITEVDRLAGVLQRFIDKLETATQGYAGLFDPVKVDMAELDQLYTFDAALTDGLQQVSDAVNAVATAAQPGSGPAPGETPGTTQTLPAALTHLGTVLDGLLTTWNHRNEVIVSGRPLPPAEFDKFRASQAPVGAPTAPLGGPAPGAPSYGPPAGQPYQPQAQAGQPYQPPQQPYQPPQQPYQPPQQPAGGQSYQPPQQPYPPQGGQPYQPYSGPSGAPAPGAPGPAAPYSGPPSTLDSGATRRIEHASDVSGPPTGGPSDPGIQGSGQ